MSRYFGFLILNQGEPYLSIFLFLTAKTFGAYSILIKILLEY
jgi:hypothetical protein